VNHTSTKRFYSKIKEYLLPGVLFCFIFLPGHLFSQLSILDQPIALPRQNNTIYHILNQISRQTGYFFIYDSELIDSDRRVRIPKTETTIGPFLNDLIEDPTLDFKIIEKHILIYRESQKNEQVAENAINIYHEPDFYIIQGRVLDHETGSPLAFATVGIPTKGLGVPANTDGAFMFKIPAVLLEDSLRVSYMGYKTRHLPMQLLTNNHVEIRLQADYISIQEVIIRYFDPMEIISEAIARKNQNYNANPTHLLSFYREGIQKDNRLVNYSEAIFRIYKAGYVENPVNDQAVVLKSRNIRNLDHTDTLLLKLKAGVQSSLDLDIVQVVPDFLDPRYFGEYVFRGAGLVNRDSRNVYVIEFEQADFVNEPLYKGMLYIDAENYAILKADFEVNPKYLYKVTDRFVVSRARRTVANIQQINYTVSYQLHNNKYHLNHVRGDIHMRIRNRNQIFGKNYHVFLEMAVSHVETENITRFRRRETLQKNVIFSEQQFQYDHEFWGEYNIITPEKHINEELQRINSKIESLVTDH
jgi:hypothetical protein